MVVVPWGLFCRGNPRRDCCRRFALLSFGFGGRGEKLRAFSFLRVLGGDGGLPEKYIFNVLGRHLPTPPCFDHVAASLPVPLISREELGGRCTGWKRDLGFCGYCRHFDGFLFLRCWFGTFRGSDDVVLSCHGCWRAFVVLWQPLLVDFCGF